MNKLKFLVFMLVVLSIGANGKPASRDWKNAFWNGGGAFLTTTYDQKVPGRIYALSDVSGLHLSIDGGENWDLSNRGVKTASYAYLHQAQADPNIMYLIGRKFLRSNNRGRDWVAVQDYSAFTTRAFRNIATDRTDASIVFVADQNGRIYRCTEYGVSCSEYDRPVTNNTIRFLYITQDNRYLIVGFSTTGMLRYDLTNDTSTAITLSGTNALRNWDFSTFNRDGVEWLCVAAGHNIQCSSNGGGSWGIVSSDLTTDSAWFISAIGSRQLANGRTRLIGYVRQISSPYGSNQIKVSDDTGETWSSDTAYNFTNDIINDPSKEWGAFGSVGNIYHFDFNPFNEDEVIVSTDWLIAISSDGGYNWAQKGKGASNQVITDCEVAPDDIGTTFCSGMDVGLYRSEDGLQSWDAILPNTDVNDPQGFAVAGHHWSIELLGDADAWNNHEGTVVVATSQWTDFIPRVWSCSDNGDTCVQGTGLPTVPLTFPSWSSSTNYVVGNQVASTNAGNPTIYICIQDHTNKTPANGANSDYWAVDANSVHAPAWGIGYPRALAKGANDKLWLCIDGYSPTPTQYGGIFTSEDAGLNWTRTTQPDQWKCMNGIAVDPTDATGNTAIFTEFWYAAPNNPHGYKTSNGGINWTDGGIEQYVGWDLAYSASGKAYKTGQKTGPQVYTSFDGVTWSEMKQLNSTANNADGLVFDPDNPERLFVSVNDATNIGPGTGVGINNTVYMTDDASSGSGATWVDLTGNFDCPSGIHKLAINKKYGKAGLLIAATDGCGVKTLELTPTVKTKLTGVSIH